MGQWGGVMAMGRCDGEDQGLQGTFLNLQAPVPWRKVWASKPPLPSQARGGHTRHVQHGLRHWGSWSHHGMSPPHWWRALLTAHLVGIHGGACRNIQNLTPSFVPLGLKVMPSQAPLDGPSYAWRCSHTKTFSISSWMDNTVPPTAEERVSGKSPDLRGWSLGAAVPKKAKLRNYP